MFAGKHARVEVTSTSTLPPSSTLIDAQAYSADESARITVSHQVFGGAKTYSACTCDLHGNAAQADIKTRYLARKNQSRDFNYIIRHRDKDTLSDIKANGVLCDYAQKTLRGTIDFVHGCKGARGNEHENVILVGENIDNKTIPVILCDEDDVAGNHGATIGHIHPEQLFYLNSRGIADTSAETLFTKSLLAEALLEAKDAPTTSALRRFVSTLDNHIQQSSASCVTDSAQQANIIKNPYKQDFPLLAKNPELAYLDSAATAQRPASVVDAQRQFYEEMNANALRGLYELSIKATQAIDAAGKHVAHFLCATSAREIVFSRNTTESLNLVAQSFAPCVLQPGDEVCITIMEHHSNLIPWQQVCRSCGAKLVYLYPNPDGVITESAMDKKIGPRTKIVSVAHVSNVLGVKNPIEELAKRVHAHGGYMIVDGAQSVAHLKVDVEKLGCDFFAFSAHKLFGPFGIGVLWGKTELLESMPPHLTGGEMIESVSEQTATWAAVPEKFEAGTQDAAGIYATAAAIDYIESVGYDAIEARESALMRYCLSEMQKLPYVEIIGSTDPQSHHGVVGFNVRGIHPHDVASILDESHVAIRAGHHCAEPLLTWLDVENLACCRASIAFYNDARDIDALIGGLKTVWRTFNG